MQAPSRHVRLLRHAALVLLAAALAWFLQPSLLQNLQSDYYTQVGEQRQIELADGSHVLLNTDTAIALELTPHSRRLRLLRGEAYFEVAHAAHRPFWVIANEVRTRVTGTSFSVGIHQGEVIVTVAQGRVETSTQASASRATTLKPGESAHYQGQQLTAVEQTDLRRALAWRQGLMVFVQAPLAEVVAEINRYRPGHLLVTNSQLKNRPITAVFSVQQIESAVTALETTLGIHTRRLGQYWVLLN